MLTSILRLGTFLSPFLLTALFAAGVCAQSTPPNASAPKPSDPALGRLFDQYATVAGGWYLEQRCNTLAPPLKNEFEWNVAQTNLALSKKANPSFLATLQRSAKDTAAKYPCNENTRVLIAQTLVLSRQTTLELTGERYSLAAKARYDGNRIAEMLAGQSLDDRCHAMPLEVRRTYDGRVKEIIANFAAWAGEPAKNHVLEVARGVDVTKVPCGGKLPDYLQTLDLDSMDMLRSQHPPDHAGPVEPDVKRP